MAAPTKYTRTQSFTDNSANFPSKPQPGQELDTEFENIEDAIGETIDALADVRRDDGELANETVGEEQIKPELIPYLQNEIGSTPGPAGPAGPQIPGPAGSPGTRGPSLPMLSGSTLPSPGLGLEGQTYLNLTNGDLYQRLSGEWTLLTNIRGPAGVGGGGVTDHGALAGLNDPDHPIAAVSGLQAALDNHTAGIATLSGSIPAVYTQGTAPTGTIAAGSLWFDTSDGNRMHTWNGASWVDVHDAQMDAVASDLADAINDIATAQATADGKIVTFVDSDPPPATGVGDLWLKTPENVLYRWGGSSWSAYQDQSITTALTNAANAQATADGKIVTFYQPSPPSPASSSVGDLWFDTDAGNKPHRYNGSNWVSIQDAAIATVAAGLASALNDIATLEGIADGYIDITRAATAPVSPDVNDIWVDSADNQQYQWDGATWVSIRDSAIADAVTDSTNAIAIADQKIRAFYQNSAPTNPPSEIDTGDLWFDLDDNNRVYRYNGAAWIDIAAVQGVVGGQVTEDGLANQSVSIRTSKYLSNSTAVLVSDPHVSSGQEIRVSMQCSCMVQHTTQYPAGRNFSVTLRRRIDGGSWTTLQGFYFGPVFGIAPASPDGERSGFVIEAQDHWRMGYTSRRGDTNKNPSFEPVPPFFMEGQADIEFYDTPGAGSIEYEVSFAIRPTPSSGSNISQVEHKRVSTLEIKK